MNKVGAAGVMVKVGVIGAGVNGIACAIKIKEKYPQFDVVVIGEELSPNTTGDGSGGLWYPYLCQDTPEDLFTKWGIATYDFLQAGWQGGGFSVCMIPVYALHREPTSTEVPKWAASVIGFQTLGEKHLESLSRLYSVKYVAGHTFTTYVVHTVSLLSHLYARFARAGGIVSRRKVTSLSEAALASFDVIVNCSGLGARELVPDDSVYPIRGQVMRVHAPWLNQVILDKSSGHYIIPNSETCVLGGTAQAHDFNTEIRPEDTEHILNGCCTMIPTLRGAKIVKQWTGLRPARHEVRLEAEERDGRLVIHNYGHGGSGVSLFWGCASDVLELLQTKINQIDTTLKSKL